MPVDGILVGIDADHLVAKHLTHGGIGARTHSSHTGNQYFRAAQIRGYIHRQEGFD